MPVPRSYGDKPFDRVVQVLEAVVAASEPSTISQIAARLSLPAPTVHRLVSQLIDRAFLRRELGSKRVLPGARLIDIGAGIVGAALRSDATHKTLRNLAAELGEQCQIGIVADGEVLYVETARGSPNGGLNVEFQPGQRAPIHCTSIGKLYLASLPFPDLKTWIGTSRIRAFTPNTIVGPTKLIKAIREVRTRGWAWNNEEYVVGIVGCAVPINNSKGQLIAGLGLSAPSARITFAILKKLIPRLQSGAATIAASLG